MVDGINEKVDRMGRRGGRAVPPAGAAMKGLLALAGIALAAVPAVAAPTGRFVVVAAPRHPAVTNMQAAYRPDDPQLVGRLVSFTGSAASFDGDYLACPRTVSRTAATPVGRLIRRIFPDRPSYGRRFVARPADFGLAMAPATRVVATQFRCRSSGPGHGADWTGTVLFPIGPARWALSLVQDQLLILAPATGPIRASFDCGKAQSATERTICGDRLLAGWDRSVAEAFGQSGDQAEQRAWLVERDRCGTDKACLHDTMSLRVLNLRP